MNPIVVGLLSDLQVHLCLEEVSLELRHLVVAPRQERVVEVSLELRHLVDIPRYRYLAALSTPTMFRQYAEIRHRSLGSADTWSAP